MASLDELPVELHTLILLQHDSLQSLHAHIRASRQAYHVFLASKARILFKVLQRLLGPDIIHTALAATEASLLRPRPLDRDTVLQFIRDFINDRMMDRPEFSVSLPVAVGLCRLHRIVEAFIEDYVQRCHLCASRHGVLFHLQSSAAEDYIPLSSVELSRLRRAFYSLHSYGRLFLSSIDDPPLFESGEAAELFIPHTPAWQVEELDYVRQYIHDRLSEVYDALEDDFVRVALAEARANHYGKCHRSLTSGAY